MVETRLLALVYLYPHPRALARHAREEAVFESLCRLEARGLVWRQRGLYRLTRRGRNELSFACALARCL